MIKPAYLEAAAALIEVYYANLQETLIRDIVSRLLHTNFAVSGTTAWRMEKLQEAGLLYDEVIKRIAEATGKSERELKKLFEDAGVETLNYGDGIYAALGIQPLSVRSSPKLLRALADGYENTKGTMRNLTNTTAIDVKGTFILACDRAYKAITSGAFSYGEAVANAVEVAAKIGAYVRYPTGHRDRVDVAARRAVLSGLGQTVGRLSEMACEELACDLVEVTAHFNARPSHAEWQGMVYSRSGKSKNYPDFSICGYGTGAGLMGWNCYHSFHPFFEGISERAYTDAELREMRENTVTYNGETLSGHQATQKQRTIERKIRESKRKLIAFDEGIKQTKGVEKGEFQMRYAYEGKRLSKLNAELDDFCRQTGMQKQYDRARVQGFGRSEAHRAASAGKKDNKRISREARFVDNIVNWPSFKGDVINPRRIFKELNKSEVGKKAIEYITANNTSIEIYYGKEMCPKGKRGQCYGNHITIFAYNTKTIRITAETVIHEVTHISRDIGESQWAEAVCFCQEAKHTKSVLTFSDLRGIIKTVKEMYPDLPWRLRR